MNKQYKTRAQKLEKVDLRKMDSKMHYYINFQTNTLGKGINPLLPPAMGLIVSLQGWLQH